MKDTDRFFKSIKFEDSNKDFKDTSIEKVVINKQTEKFIVYLNIKDILKKDIIDSLFAALKNKISGLKEVDVKINYLNKNSEAILEYFKILFNELLEKRPSLIGLLDSKISMDNNIITVEVSNKIEELEVEKEINNFLNRLEKYGFNDIKIETYLNKELEQNIIKSINENKSVSVKKEVEEESNIIMGKHIDGDIERLDNILADTKNIIVEAYIFGIDTMERENINIITLKISDKTNSMLAKIFKRDKDEYHSVLKHLKEGSWYRFHGNVDFDNFAKDLVLSIRNLEKIDSKDNKLVDDAEVKRVELHAHTFMSMMDSVVPAKDLMKHALALGHKAVAVTDHNCLQSYPDLYHEVCAYNKGKEGEDRFKVLYGAELNVVNDDVDVVFNPKEYNLMDQTYVVFDTETTGFHPGHDQMIEIGAVKIKNDEIIDRFDELIDPQRPLPKKITELTCITDEMLQGKDSEENVTKRFLEWVGDLPMVAHNAKFDISFMKMSMQKYGLGEFENTVLDTMSIARILNPDWPNHKLTTLVRRYKIDWDEDAHHRADYDSEGTAKAFYKMAKIMYDRNIETTMDVYNSIDQEQLVKFSFPFHITLYAKNKVGLKNLFKIISMANTKYLYKNDQPKIPRKEIIAHKDGLIIGSGCVNGEIFEAALTKEDDELSNMMQFYDFIEVQPIEHMTQLLQMESSGFKTEIDLQNHIKKIIRVAKEAGKIVCATGDVHNLTKEDKIYREIICAQRTNGKLHPLNRKGITVPNMSFKTTNEMKEAFSFLEDQELIEEIVVENTNKIADEIEELEVIIETGGIPFAPKIDNSQMIVTNMVYEKATRLYGFPLPHHIEERLALELYGAKFIDALKLVVDNDEEKLYPYLHDTVTKGPEVVAQEMAKGLMIANSELTQEEALKEANDKLTAIIGANFDVIYLIAQKLVKHSNDEGYLVGSRGSVGSSLVAYMMGITEVNSLSPHYRCPKCKKSFFNDENGDSYGNTYKCGYDLPDKECSDCHVPFVKDGHDIPFETFLGFNADKVPDIDLNFSDLNQASAHEYTKVLFGVDNVYRAGTIGTVAEKTAFGFVRGYCEEKNIIMRNIEVERLAKGCTGVKRTTGQHPGGIVVIPGYMDVYDFTPFQYPAEDPTSAWRTTHFDYHAIDQDVLKLDILGHTDPTQLRMIQDITGDDITKVPLDDKATMSIFTSTKALGVTKDQIMCETGTLGVPEFGTGFTIKLVEDTKPTTFAELVKISGLAHGTDVWLGNAQELIKNNVVPFAKVIGCRDDIMVELMYRGLPPFKAFKIMEFVRKGRASKPKDAQEWQEYVKLMHEYDVDEWFINSCAKIKYMFPKAHAAAYVTSAFRIAWYKVHKPIVYYATYFSTRFDDFDVLAMIGGYDSIKTKMMELQSKGYDMTNKESSTLETLKLALEATARGFNFKNIDIEKSDSHNFVIDEDEKSLIMPFRALDGLGEQVAKTIIAERENKPYYSIEDLQIRGKVNTTTMAKLRALGVLDGMPETSQLSLF